MASVGFRPLIQFDRGLEEIFDAFGEEVFLPSAVAFNPAELVFSDRLQATLWPPTLDDFLRMRLAPDVNQALLTPHIFNDIVESTINKMVNMPYTPSSSAVLGILKNDMSLRDLLMQFRNALIKG